MLKDVFGWLRDTYLCWRHGHNFKPVANGKYLYCDRCGNLKPQGKGDKRV